MSEFSYLQCGLTNDHIVEKPIILLCGHNICKKCVPDQAKIKCKICSVEMNKSELRVDMESVPIKNSIKRCLSGLFDDLEKRATDEMDSFKSLLENRESTIDAHIKYIEEEIEIRIESIKINLDELLEKFKIDLIGIKKDIIENQNEALYGKTDTKELENSLNELRDYIKKNQSKTEERFYEYQENFKKINKMIKTFQEAFYSCKLDLKVSKDQVNEKLIGEVLFEGSAYKKMKETLLKGKFELIQVADYPLSLISLPSGNLVCSTDGSVKLLDENFKEIKSVSTGGFSCCALNHRNEIYMSDSSNHCIISFDLNLNKIKQFGTKGAGNNELNGPWSLCFHDLYLYICDFYNKRIQILTVNFDYISTFQLDGLYPYRVNTSETTIGVSCPQATLFYDLKTRALKFKHNNYGTWNINYIDSTFYGSDYSEKKFYFFDSDGNFIEEMVMNENLSKHISNWPDGSLCVHKMNLYLVDYESSEILKLIQ